MRNGARLVSPLLPMVVCVHRISSSAAAVSRDFLPLRINSKRERGSGNETDRRGAYTLPAEVLKVSAGFPDGEAIGYAAQLISRGGVVGVPTDTFYILAADPLNLAAVEIIYRVKVQ